MVQEAKILERTFRDRLTAVRKKAGEDQETGETSFCPYVVYQDIPCALSAAGNSAPDREGNHKYVEDNMTLFSGPGIFLQAGDQVTVITEAGQQVTGETGRTMAYTSHGETPIKVKSIV